MSASLTPSNDKDHWMGHQWSKMTSEDLQQASEDLKKPSAQSKKSAKRKSFTPRSAKAPF